MQKVLNALKKMGIDAVDSPELREQVATYAGGQDPDSLTAPQAVQVAEAIAASLKNGALTTTQNSAPATRGKKREKVADITDSIERLAAESGKEMNALTAPILQGIDQWTDREAATVVGAIKDAPVTLTAKIGVEALRAVEESDPAFFRQTGERLGAIFGFGLSIDAAE